MKILSIILLSAILLAGIFYKFYLPADQTLVTTLVYPKAKLLPNFNLIDHNAKSFTNEQLKNKWSVVFFGFTYCPDVCPTTMAALSQIANKLPPEIMSQLQFVFVSVDPERDTAERLAEYIAFYHSDFIALTGGDEQLQQFSLSLGAVYMKVPTEESYTMSHSSRLFIIDPKGQRYGIFSNSDSGAIDVVAITQDLETIINR
ncbi:MAG: protein SCO1/2 [Enterobacterales bacterium]|jgi:protein SCO1/2